MLADWIQNRGGITKTQHQDALKRNPFSDWLPWIAYDAQDHGFLNTDNTWGYLWECVPHAFTSVRETKVLEGLISQPFPNGAVLQFMLYADDNINGFLNTFRESKQRDNPLVKKSVEEITQFYRNCTSGSPQSNGIPVRNYRCFFTVKTEKRLSKDFHSNIHDALVGARLSPKIMNAPHLLSFVRGIFSKQAWHNEQLYDDLLPIRKQVINAEQSVSWQSHNDNVTKVGDRYARCITPKLLPNNADLTQTNKLVGAIMGVEEDGDQINVPFLWCLNIITEEVKTEIHTKASIMMAQRSVGSFSAKLKKRVEELAWALDNLEREKFVSIIPTLWVFGDTEEKAREGVSRAKRIWESQGYAMQEESKISRPLFIASLPFGLYKLGNNIRLLERDFPVPISVAARMAPIQADFRGTNSAVLAFSGRKGQIVGIDVFDDTVNNHNFLITAGSGAGKSFTLNYLCANYYAAGSLVRLIDIGYSYKKLCSIFDGRYLDFGKEHICINPFHSLGLDKEDLESDLQATANVVAEMVYSASGSNLTETEWTLVKNAVRFAINRDDGGERGIDHVYDYLHGYPKYVNEAELTKDIVPEIITRAKIMAFNLADYTSKGRYGRFFNGKSTFDISSDEFVVLELEKLKGQRELFKVVTLQVANACTQDLYLSDRSRSRFILFEEAYQFLKLNGDKGNERIGRIIEEGYRRARKYGGSFGIVTQSLNDLSSFGSSGPVIKNNSAFKFLLEADDYEDAANKKIVNYDGLALDILSRVKNNKPKYSEIFFDTPLGMGVGRLIVDPWNYWIATSSSNEVAQYDTLIKQGLTPFDAIKRLSKT